MNRVHLFGVDIDVMTMQDAVSAIDDSLRTPDAACQYVVTPNVDHVVVLEKHPEFRAAYEDASLVLADGWPVVLASRLLRKSLPERVSGSDFVPAIFDQAQLTKNPLRIYLLGAGPSVAERAAENIQAKWPAVEVVGCYSPPFGFEKEESETEAILDRIREAKPHLLVVGLGAPKQELWVHQHQSRIHANWALCVGACIDFMAGEKRRAPYWMQKCGLEWFFRMLSEPRRLFKRYAYDAIRFPLLVLKEFFSSKPAASQKKEAEQEVRV